MMEIFLSSQSGTELNYIIFYTMYDCLHEDLNLRTLGLGVRLYTALTMLPQALTLVLMDNPEAILDGQPRGHPWWTTQRPSTSCTYLTWYGWREIVWQAVYLAYNFSVMSVRTGKLYCIYLYKDTCITNSKQILTKPLNKMYSHFLNCFIFINLF